MAKMLFIVPYAKCYLNFYWDLIESLVQDGHHVTAVAPDTDAESALTAIGVRFIQIPIKNTGINPFYDIRSVCYLTRVLREERPDILCCYSIKPILYGSLAARMARSRRVFVTVTGLGYLFTERKWKQRLLLPLVTFLYRFAFQHCERAFFENPDDLRLFKQLGLIERNNTTIVNGSGVNLDKFTMTRNRPVQSQVPLTFILIARIIKDKGIYEYIEAARILKAKYPSVKLCLLGPFDSNPSSISKTQVAKWMEEGVVNYLGEAADVRPYLRNSNIFVLPSYREGTPKSTLEAMAMGLPIITTDVPGCRETVIQDFNGLIVPVKNGGALAAAMERFILNPQMTEVMGANSRELAESKYDVHKVIGKVRDMIQI
ncbi:glycosyltransferase family 4 protein [Paenibacillus chondroitinus]|uniref:Glycosyltransferase family 4 protein n=1 Tax=Paenibacillus chondroitinus TaxID=59842 RepID=A0ABU6DMG5_9BACL|nr:MULTISPECIES: glycosyltransferase family 4 protein [Paenibacillus]MCY9660969.1 glycosyltransferase family 4 protein [Paenibacillus anseongense]MEB4797972.1 glycosyltransferase family 4 protein [Paenibacillus chondroitinus]